MYELARRRLRRKGPRWGRLVAAAALAGGVIGCAGEDRVATVEEPLIQRLNLLTFNPDVAILEGFNALTDNPKRGSCLSQIKKKDCAEDPSRNGTSGVNDVFELTFINSRKELTQKLGIEANLSARYKVVEASASVNIEKESQFTQNTVTFLLKGETTYWTNVNKADYSIEFTNEAKRLFDEANKPEIPSLFFNTCGDSWVEGYQRGAQFYVMFTFTATSQESRDALEAKLKVALKLPVVGAEAEVGAKVANLAREFNARVDLKIRAHGFQYGNQAATNAIIEAALTSKLDGETFKKLAEIHTDMQKSVNTDRCIDLRQGYTRAKKEGDDWVCTDQGASPGKSSHLLRVNLADYTGVGNRPEFTEMWKPLVNYEKKVEQAKRYIAQLAALEDAMLGAYYDEIQPYLSEKNDIGRSMYGLAPPQILPRNQPFFKLDDQDKNVNDWADRFKPPGGSAVRRVHVAGENCWAGVTRAEFDKCTCKGGLADVTDTCLAALDAYRLSWNDLFDYRETGRVLPLRVFSPRFARTHEAGVEFCEAYQSGSMINYPDLQRAALVVANTSYGQNKKSTWYLNPPEGSPYPRCPASSFTAEQAARLTKPLLENQPQSVEGRQNLWGCHTREFTTGVLCVPGGGLFSPAYGDRLTAIPKPPPQVAWSEPALREVGVASGTKITLVFSSKLDASTLDDNVLLKDGTTVVPVELVYAHHPRGGGTIVLTPSAPLTPSKLYTIEVGTGVKGVDGDQVIAKWTSTFTVANEVKTFTPAPGDTGVSLTPQVKAEFAAPVNAATVNATNIRLWRGNTQIPATVTYNNATKTATLTPNAALTGSTMYTVSVDNVRDPGPRGNPVAYVWWTFTTGVTITTVSPEPNATDIDRAEEVFIGYTGDLSEVPEGALTLKKGATSVAGTASVVLFGKHLSFKPSAPLEANTRYTVTVTKAVKDKQGKPVLEEKTWSFTTGTQLTPPEQP